MSAQPVLAIFEPAPFVAVPACAYCGAQGPRITEELPWMPARAVALFAVLAIADHVREMHPEVSRG